MESGHRITEDMLRQALAEEFGVDANKDVKVNGDFAVTGGSAKGDNYMCEMKAITLVADVKGRKDGSTYHYMAKCFPMNEHRVKFIVDCGVFETEAIMYRDLMPKLRELEPRLKSPLTVYADSQKGVMIMENLKEQGYYMIDKVVGLDMTEIKLVLTQLALLHATSYHFLQCYPYGEDAFRKDYPNLDTDNWISTKNEDMAAMFEGMMATNTDLFYEVIKEHNGHRTELVKRLKNFASARKERVDSAHQKRGKFNCIIHNDSWCNNFLFRKDQATGETTEIKILDLQLSRIARPSIDLAYFFGSSTKPSFRQDHLSSLMRFYHGVLVAKLNEFGYSGEELYSFFDLKKDFEECRVFSFVMSQMHAMIQLTPQDSPDKIDVDETDADAEAGARKFKEGQLREARRNQVLRERLIQIAEEAAEVGVI